MMNMEQSLYTVVNIMFLMMVFATIKVHTLSNIIVIEFMIISVTMMMFMMINSMKMETYLVMYFMVTAISESIMGLSILIAMIRTHGNDYTKLTMMMKW